MKTLELLRMIDAEGVAMSWIDGEDCAPPTSAPPPTATAPA